MILKDGTEIDLNAGGSYKYGRDGMAEYLHYIAQNAGSDYAFGDCQSPTGAVDLFGRRVLRQDDRGFVWVTKYPNADEARAAVEHLETTWLDWLNDVTCNVCDGDFNSEDGACWSCGARSARTKGEDFDPRTCDQKTLKNRREHRRGMGLADDTSVSMCSGCGYRWITGGEEEPHGPVCPNPDGCNWDNADDAYEDDE